MRTWDGRIVIIPNSDVLSNAITNFSRAEHRRIEISVGVAYGSDTSVARKTVLDAIQNIPGYVSEPEPTVVFHTFASSSIDMTAYFWIDTAKTNPFLAKDGALELIHTALAKKGIDIPFPIRTVHMQSQ
jgi:small-conductance mechanosensitive channel